MTALFVHGMGRSPLSGFPVLHRLRAAGLEACSFGYFVALEDVERIVTRLVARIEDTAARGRYFIVAHSLGGVLARAALARIGVDVARPEWLFLPGSPVRPARLACRLARNPVYRLRTGDCGQLLASEARMAAIGHVLDVPAIGIAGVRGAPISFGPFGAEPNDGVVSVSETSAEWLAHQVQVPVIHTLLPASSAVAALMLERMRGNDVC